MSISYGRSLLSFQRKDVDHSLIRDKDHIYRVLSAALSCVVSIQKFDPILVNIMSKVTNPNNLSINFQ